MIDFQPFGYRDRFEIAIRPARHRDPIDRRPQGYGWLLGDLKLTVGGRILTQHQRDGQPRRDHVTWYLLPLFEWLAEHWVDLLHEEEFGWREGSTLAAAAIVPRVLAESIGKDDADAMARYDAAQAWRGRHGLRAAAEGGIFPDLYIRRFLDTIELSWSDVPALFAPDDMRFVSRPGYAGCAVGDVATPLWDALTYVVDGGLGLPDTEAERQRFAALQARLAEIRALTVVDFARARVAAPVLAAAIGELGAAVAADLFQSERVADDVPAVAAFAPAIAMYGGLSPTLGGADVGILSRLVLDAQQRGELPALAALVEDKGGVPRRSPALEGYTLAEDLLEEWDIERGTGAIDIRALVARLDIAVHEHALETDSIRGVSLAGQGMAPTILVNTTSIFNRTDEGRRFTLAHELCHILYDRGRAKRLGLTSGPWVPAAVERRANAFAAMLLMPRSRVIEAFGAAYDDAVELRRVAGVLQVTPRALVEHLHNIHLIDEVARERLRAAFGV
ncbi:ImmA/IrrE family metallo-endopeptidase [Sphingomonas sp. RP10(2022)]|uniref:ImmA/IrrE family metallo-endopeptidase n=1 Tax=Sphingomonas liriopis TaxID=2949094 RepID=A0A9X2KV02_9SPHN|nr:ImmA/IrrE family metallo-endopeptidase [Sphingomonas liriopis]MCP3736498.1 ImmA/IrrE family metallo-endopeptidase [Sphingomonas liriopis]